MLPALWIRKLGMHVLTSTLSIGLGVYTVLLAYMWLQQHSYIYFPGDALVIPRHADGQYEDVVLHTSDGEQLGSWFVPAATANAAATILFCQGNAGTRADRWSIVQRLRDFGFNVMIFDYRGYADSSGRASEAGTYRDVEAAWNYLVDQRGIAAGDIILYGRSLGGAIASWMAVHSEPRALILEGAFTSVIDVGREMFPWLPVRLLSRFSYDNLARLPQLRCPVIIVHARHDQVIDFSHGQKLYAAASAPKRLLELNGSHVDDSIVASDEFQQILADLAANRFAFPDEQ